MPANYRPAVSVDPALLAAQFNSAKNQARQESAEAAAEPAESGNPAADLRTQVMAAKHAQAAAVEKTEESGGAAILDLKTRAKEYILDAIPLYNGYRALKKLLTGQKIFQGLLNIFLILFTNFYAVIVIFGALALFVIIVAVVESKLVQVVLKLLGGVLSLFGNSLSAITDLF